MQRIADGDLEAFERIYDELTRPMFSLVNRIVGSRAEAEEVLLIGFEQVWRTAACFQPERGSAFTWITTIMRHKAIDAIRARVGHLRRTVAAFEQRGVEDGPQNGLELLNCSDRGAFVRSALAQLTASEQHALNLAFFDGLTHEEIAEALVTPVGTIKARIRRALVKLRPALAHVHI